MTIISFLAMMMVVLLGTAYADWRIINGTNAIMNEFPSLVSLKINGQHFCGGTLIGPNTVLTAGHCVWPVKDLNGRMLRYYNVHAVLGEYDQYRVSGQERIFQVIVTTDYVQITETRHHPRFSMDTTFTGGYDVGIMKFEGSVSATEFPYITYANIATSRMTRPGQMCTLTGWGSMMPPGEDTARILQKAELQIMSAQDCSYVFPNVLRIPSNICAGRGRLSISGCRGDSGGPLFCSFNGKRVQVGIVSYGMVPCGSAYVPSVFTRVSEVASWITSNSN